MTDVSTVELDDGTFVREKHDGSFLIERASGEVVSLRPDVVDAVYRSRRSTELHARLQAARDE